ncbi:MAG TPA: hypothetical protein VIY27_01865 [Myxococcota bacterium]
MKTLALGANGFFGHSLTKQILEDTAEEFFRMESGDDRASP